MIAPWVYMLETVCGAVGQLEKSWIAPSNVIKMMMMMMMVIIMIIM